MRAVEVHMEDILDELHKTNFEGGLIIESDSCYSGALCYRAKEEW